ncbi:hypothetical protein SAMN05428976_10763 [Clostridium sp. USBA 49]|uniref:DUF6512 family protein n=1 Tax=Clostridium sp. USBA 49 TaxID=1881060 RepID=UPI00099B0C9D|nr:DUF6512 family protein [Clostridium sp. USBA 49]SKA85224.1 hypothetical protein SAMN05428976_10763 [Clostridium sp. USBA 49]
MRYKTMTPYEKWIIKGVPAIFLIGTFMHFLYDLSGKNIIVGLIAAVNESVWEHLKLVLLPIICWWSFYYFIKCKKYNIDKNKWFTSALVAVLTALITIPLLYYFYTEAFGIEILAVDISILFLAVLFGQLLAFHFYKYSKEINIYITICIFIFLILVFMIFTLYPPHIPLFRDSITGQYGI